MSRRSVLAIFIVAAAVAQEHGAPTPVRSELPRVLIIGDSISDGHMPPLRKILALEAYVDHIPWDGMYGNSFLSNHFWDVIAFNSGLQDLKLSYSGRHQVEPLQYGIS